MSLLAHGLAIIGFVACYEVFWVLEKFQIKSTVLGLLSIFSLQRFVFKTFVAIFMTRELHHDATNRAWWSGKWIKSKVSNYYYYSLKLI
jgi:1,3-beta-glucan synthase